jgi:hypothetical protein
VEVPHDQIVNSSDPFPDYVTSSVCVESGGVNHAPSVTGLGGFNNQIQVVCAVPTQDNMTCSPTPQQITPTGTVSFTVQTFAAGGTTAMNRGPLPWWPRAAGGTALAGLIFLLLPMGRRARIFTEGRARAWMMLALMLAGLGSVGIGCGGSSASVAQNSGTPLGVATLTITAASYVDNTVVSHTVYLTVNVIAPGSSASVGTTTTSK